MISKEQLENVIKTGEKIKLKNWDDSIEEVRIVKEKYDGPIEKSKGEDILVAEYEDGQRLITPEGMILSDGSLIEK